MNRPWIVWTTALCCAFIVLGAIGMMTRITLNLETKIFIDDKRDGRVRDAMGAMDYYVDSLMARENRRKAEDYAPLNTILNRDLKDNNVTVEDKLSPLFNDVPDDVELFWYSGLGKRFPVADVTSPQTPSWGLIKELPLTSSLKGSWKGSLNKQDELVGVLNGNISNPSSLPNSSVLGNNLGKAGYLASCAMVYNDRINSLPNSLAGVSKEMAEVVDSETEVWSTKQAKADRNLKGTLQKKLRSQSRTKFQPKANQQRSLPSYDSINNSNFGYNSISQESANPYLGKFSSAQISPFVAAWLSNELMLLRKVVTESDEYVQGVWLNKDMVEQGLLEQAQVFLPNAKLIPVSTAIDNKTLSYDQKDPLVLSKVPLKLVVGNIPDSLNKVTPMRLILIIAWVCVIFAILAVIIMFRGVMKLSERRASFVSSVSHELRTPLTTFKLYSEMLATGMVRDENKKQKYLDTLITESDRLTHMVENVLSFSQLEKGKKKSLQVFSLDGVLGPLSRNFEIRLAEEGMLLDNRLSKGISSIKVKADQTSVDQILTNLIDNAAKYGQSNKGGGIVTLSAEVSGKYLKVYVADEGKGIPNGTSRRVFKEFHKSDIEAAHSKPGVGLGLALCQRLARSMGGDLSVIKKTDSGTGACVELKLKLAQ